MNYLINIRWCDWSPLDGAGWERLELDFNLLRVDTVAEHKTGRRQINNRKKKIEKIERILTPLTAHPPIETLQVVIGIKFNQRKPNKYLIVTIKVWNNELDIKIKIPNN